MQFNSLEAVTIEPSIHIPVFAMTSRLLFISFLMLLGSSHVVHAQSLLHKEKEEMPQAIIGLSTYLGGMRDDKDHRAYYAGASLYAFFVNASLEVRTNVDAFERDQQIQPYAGVGLGRLLQLQQGIDFSSKRRLRLVTEIALDEWVDKRNHIIVQGFIEQVHTSSSNDRRYGIALGYTF